MLRNYLIIALRNLRRQPFSTLINVVGLGAAMTVSLLVLLLIEDQRSYDRFHENADRIVRVISARQDAQMSPIASLAATPAYLGPALQVEVPEVEQTLRFGQIRSDAEANAKALYVEGLHAEPAFFSLFDFRLLRGDPTSALTGPHRIILSEETARKFFGEADPIGQPFSLAEFGDYTVTGVIQTEEVKSHLRFDVLASFETLGTVASTRTELEDADNFWRFATYVLLRQGSSPDVLQPHLNRLAQRYDGAYVLTPQRLTDIMLGPALSNEIAAYNLPGFIVWVLLGLGITVVLAAVFNYIGLAVAQATRRAREVGIRKALGAHPVQLRAQFLVESVLTALGALGVGMALQLLLIPAFNNLALLSRFEIQVNLSLLYDPGLLGLYFGFTLLIGLLAGGFPALQLSRFQPSLVLRGSVGDGGGSASRLRRGLAFVQLTLAFFFVVTTVLLVRQFAYMQADHFGFHVRDQLTVLLQGNDPDVLGQELLRLPDVVGVGVTSRLPAADGGTSARMAHETDTLDANYFSASAGFLRNLELHFVAGRNFEDASAGQPGVVLNETATERLGFARPEEALGAPIWFFGQFRPVIGVVRNFQVDALSLPLEPLVIFNDPTFFRTMIVRVHPGREAAVLTALQSTWARIDTRHTLEYGFYLQRVQENEAIRVFQDGVRIIGLLATLALMIACLGLLSIVAYVAARRTKEIGIRKVMGASVPNVVWLLSREFLVLTVVAALVALPLAYFANRLWLDNFYDRVAFGGGILLTGAVIVLALVLLTVGTQALRAALADPVKSLRYE
jgi:putative ABC transport system permease protein